MSDCKEIEFYARRIADLERLCRKLTEVVEDFMPNIGKCALQDYGRLNDALIESRRLLVPEPTRKSKTKKGS
jgi:hypothetical protein